MKDYYKIMNVPYDASAEDIRRAYRHFAKKYHPDKNSDQINSVLFLDIQEAYHNLSDEQRRRNFHLKTNYPLPGSKQTSVVVSAESILQQCRQLHSRMQNSNRHQLNPAFISGAVDQLLSEKNIRVVVAEKKLQIQEEIAVQLLPVIKLLPYRLAIPHVSRLLRIAVHNTPLQEQIMAFGNRKRKLRYWEKYNLIIVLAATLLLCALIVFLSE